MQRSKGIPPEAEVNDIFAGSGRKGSRRDTCGEFSRFFRGEKEYENGTGLEYRLLIGRYIYIYVFEKLKNKQWCTVVEERIV